jgi:hypothetical protein
MTLSGDNESADRLFHAGRHRYSDLRHARLGALQISWIGDVTIGVLYQDDEFHAHF